MYTVCIGIYVCSKLNLQQVLNAYDDFYVNTKVPKSYGLLFKQQSSNKNAMFEQLLFYTTSLLNRTKLRRMKYMSQGYQLMFVQYANQYIYEGTQDTIDQR